MMKRWLPYPRLAALVLIAWLLMNQSLAPGQILLGMLLALIGTQLLVRLQPPPGFARRVQTMAVLFVRVLLDIIRSNIAVASIILSRRAAMNRTAGFVHIQLTSRHPYVLTTLACIITATPGTIWVDYESTSGVLTIHVLDLIDEETWIRTITQRYESLLREIFE